jgi:hypothetical protein
MLESISGQAFAEWVAYASLEPFGQDWLQTGTVTAAVVNAAIDPKKHEPFEPTDFIPGYEKPAPEPEDVAAKVEAYFMALAKAPSPGPSPKSPKGTLSKNTI